MSGLEADILESVSSSSRTTKVNCQNDCSGISLFRQAYFVDEGFPAWVIVELGKQGLEWRHAQKGMPVVVSVVQPFKSVIDLTSEGVGFGYQEGIPR